MDEKYLTISRKIVRAFATREEALFSFFFLEKNPFVKFSFYIFIIFIILILFFS